MILIYRAQHSGLNMIDTKNVKIHCHITASFVAVDVQRYNILPIGHKEGKELGRKENTSKTLQCSAESVKKTEKQNLS